MCGFKTHTYQPHDGCFQFVLKSDLLRICLMLKLIYDGRPKAVENVKKKKKTRQVYYLMISL